jgi:hypothetical protein
MRTAIQLVAAVTLTVLGTASPAAGQRGDPFPHARHAKLFVGCSACHAGVATGEDAKVYPAAATCRNCHNGRDEKEVSWTSAAKRPNNLRFSHREHERKAALENEVVGCASCHATARDTAWMRVGRSRAEGCIACHEHRASDHLAEASVCRTCHVTLVEARALPVNRIAAFPKPSSHAKPNFAAAHAPSSDAAVAQCATCHARESCARCHPNASKVASISRLGTDARVAELMRGLAALYPTPASHQSTEWAIAHGPNAKSEVSSCANCHTQSTCTSCHRGGVASKSIAMLPSPAANDGPGVKVTPSKVHPGAFAKTHGSTAASGRLDCAGCHTNRECTSCHEGSSAKRYHEADFSSRHATQAYAQDQTCASCHRTETFCRSCHISSGVTVKNATTGAGHAGQPLWLFQHSQAARQGLTSCATCHQQRDCLRCHSDLGLRVNPHGSEFDASRVSARNRRMCLTCHLTDPMKP